MKIIGLTGSIGMGKSTVAAMLRQMGVPVFCSDEAVHALLEKGGPGVRPVSEHFKDVLVDGRIDRQKLGRAVFGNPDLRRQLESILHPLVWQMQNAFLNRARREKKKLVVLDIPLLFETGREADMDEVWVVHSPAFIQERRVLKRPGMTREKFAAIRASQLPNHIKKKHATRHLHTSLGIGYTRRQLQSFLKEIL
ncbi:dephospho-CoA kinase [bacterium]|nr:dephospho-CoA kinase [bacterium]